MMCTHLEINLLMESVATSEDASGNLLAELVRQADMQESCLFHLISWG